MASDVSHEDGDIGDAHAVMTDYALGMHQAPGRQRRMQVQRAVPNRHLSNCGDDSRIWIFNHLRSQCDKQYRCNQAANLRDEVSSQTLDFFKHMAD